MKGLISMMIADIPNNFIDNAKVMSKGQVTIPKDIRTVLGLDQGSRVTFIVRDGNVQMVNSAVYAMKMLQAEMNGEAEKTNIRSEEDVNALVKSIRSED